MLEQLRDLRRALVSRRHPIPPTRRGANPFDEGVCAARMGMEIDDNPYCEDSQAFEDWEAGYESSVEARKATDLD